MQVAPFLSDEGAKGVTILAAGLVRSARQRGRQHMYYRLAMQQRRDPLDEEGFWQWKSTALSSLESLFQVLRLYRALPQERLRVFSSPCQEGLQEQLRQANSTGGSASVTAAHFLQQHLLRSPGVTEAGGTQRHEVTASIAVSTTTRLDESATTAPAPGERNRLEHERGAGGDHDVPYHFALPLSLPQVLAWARLLGRVQRGELEP